MLINICTDADNTFGNKNDNLGGRALASYTRIQLKILLLAPVAFAKAPTQTNYECTHLF